MKHIFRLAIGLLLMMALPVQAQSPFPLNGNLKQCKMTSSSYYLDDQTIYTVDGNITIFNSLKDKPGLEVRENATAIIYIQRGCSIIVSGGTRFAGIRVPQNAKLVIAGDEGSYLCANGGSASEGKAGADGGNAYVNATTGKMCYSGYGGAGGDGGAGAGAGIGGNGGLGGQGAPQTKRVETVHYKSLEGHDGVNGVRGGDGDPMGEVFISGSVVVRASGGSANYYYRHPMAGRGRNDESGYWVPFCRHKMNAGGGGGGGSGAVGGICKVGIGGGAPGGGGGGAGGSGATDAYEGAQAGDGLGAQGEGGYGGEGADCQVGVHGYDFGCQATFHNPNILSGSGGRGGSPGNYGGNGLLLAQKMQNFDDASDYSWATLVAVKYPVKLMVYYAKDDISPIRPNDYRFYYGMVPPQTVEVPYSPDTAYKFGGYFLPDSTMIYDLQGKLTDKGKNLLYRFSDVTLYPYWVGPSQVRLDLKYEKSDVLPDEDPWQVYPYFAYYFVLPEQSKHIKWCAKDYLPAEGYSTDTTKCMDIELQPSTQYRDSFIYTLQRHEMYWTIPEDIQGMFNRVYMKNDQGQHVKQYHQTLKYHQTVVAPSVYFENAEDSNAVTIVGWTHQPTIMPDSNVTINYLEIARKVEAIYVGKHDYGTVAACNWVGDTVENCFYGDTITLRLHPKMGYHALAPEVNEYIAGEVGEEVELTQVDDNTYQFCCTRSVMVTPAFEASEYTMAVNYVYDSIPQTAEPYTYVQSKNNPEAVLVSELVYHYGDVLTFAGWLDDDTLENWIMVPVCTMANGDTVDLQMNFTDKIKDRHGKKVTMPCYSFTAPNGNLNLEQTVYYRPKQACVVYNLTEDKEIDSVLVNFNAITLKDDSIAMVRTLDVVSLQVLDPDTSVARAGYWDDNHQYQRLPMSIESIEVGGGDFATLFSTMAPGYPMSIGLVDGLKIMLQHCDTVVSWQAPSAAEEGDTVIFRIEENNPRNLVVVDSVLLYNENSELQFRFEGEDAWRNQFVMPNHQLFVYVYAHVANTYHTVTYLNINGDTLQHSDWHLIGDTVSYNGSTPSYESDTTYLRYEYVGWSPEIHPVAGDDVYRATYKRYIALDEKADNDAIIAAYDGEVVNIDLTRSMNPQYYMPVAFPFDLTMAKVYELFGEETVVGKFSSMSNENNTLTFRFKGLTNNDTLYAGTPYLMRAGQLTMQLTVENVVMVNRLDTIKMEWAEFTPIFSPYWMNDRDYSILFPLQNRLCYPANPSGPFRGMRAYFKLKNGVDGRMRSVLAQEGVNAVVDYVDGNASADPAVDEVMEMDMVFVPFDPIEETTAVEWITPSGNEHAVKMIHNGIFYIRHNGILYDAQGQRL